MNRVVKHGLNFFRQPETAGNPAAQPAGQREITGIAVYAALEAQSRYISRLALVMDALVKLDDGTLSLEAPPDPRTGFGRDQRQPERGLVGSPYAMAATDPVTK